MYLNSLCVKECIDIRATCFHYTESSCSLTLFSDNLTDSVKEASVARSEGTLVMDHLHLKDEERTI